MFRRRVDIDGTTEVATVRNEDNVDNSVGEEAAFFVAY